MNFTWDDAKRQSNLRKHELDFADAEQVFAGPMATFEDTRHVYAEQRLIGLGLLNGLVVVIIHVEADTTIRVISMRKASHHEADLFYQTFSPAR